MCMDLFFFSHYPGEINVHSIQDRGHGVSFISLEWRLRSLHRAFKSE